MATANVAHEGRTKSRPAKPHRWDCHVRHICGHEQTVVLSAMTRADLLQKRQGFLAEKKSVAERHVCHDCRLSEIPFTAQTAATHRAGLMAEYPGYDYVIESESDGLSVIVMRHPASGQEVVYRCPREILPPLTTPQGPHLRVRTPTFLAERRDRQRVAFREKYPPKVLPRLSDDAWAVVQRAGGYFLSHICGHRRGHRLRPNDDPQSVQAALNTAGERLCPTCMESSTPMTDEDAHLLARTVRSLWPKAQVDAYPLRGAKATYHHGVLFREARADIATVLTCPVDWKPLQVALIAAGSAGVPLRKRCPEFHSYHALLDDLLLHPERMRPSVILLRAVEAARRRREQGEVER